MNDLNYNASCMLTSVPVSDLENFKCLSFVVVVYKELMWTKSCIFQISIIIHHCLTL
jgi:hypothetical protein